jgi:hypothetical protein
MDPSALTHLIDTMCTNNTQDTKLVVVAMCVYVSVCVSLSSCQRAAVAAAEAPVEECSNVQLETPKRKRKKTGADER